MAGEVETSVLHMAVESLRKTVEDFGRLQEGISADIVQVKERLTVLETQGEMVLAELREMRSDVGIIKGKVAEHNGESQARERLSLQRLQQKGVSWQSISAIAALLGVVVMLVLKLTGN